MKNLLLVLSCSIVFLGFSHFLIAKTFDWQVEYAKINNQITAGDFKNANKYNEILLDKVYKLQGAESAIYAAVKFQEARLSLDCHFGTAMPITAP